ncbi:YIF1-domain-containing protein, partial [Rozella allomycis CSF55]
MSEWYQPSEPVYNQNQAPFQNSGYQNTGYQTQNPQGYTQNQGYPQNQGYSQNGYPPQNQDGYYTASPFLNQLQSNPTAQIGLQLGTQALNAGQQYVNQNFSEIQVTLIDNQQRYYFSVTNSYVMYKLMMLLFPFRNKRVVYRNEMNGQVEGYKPPREDLNAPDLYIPSMSFVTYAILYGVCMGIEEKFSPEMLG